MLEHNWEKVDVFSFSEIKVGNFSGYLSPEKLHAVYLRWSVRSNYVLLTSF